MTRPRFALLVLVAVFVVLCLCWFLWRSRGPSSAPSPAASSGAPGAAAPDTNTHDLESTVVYAHNLMLRKGPDFRIYIVWIAGQMLRTRPQVVPSFDDPESFVLEIQKGVIHANIGDISKFLNASSPANAPLKNISIQPNGEQVKLRGTVHKIVPLPIELDGTLAATPDGRVQFHIARIDVLKIPVKGLLGDFHVKLSDLVPANTMPGIQIAGNDIFFDTQKLLPPPHIHGQLTSIRVRPPDLEVIYGNAPNDENRLAQWHNFLRFRNGAVNFGKLTMSHTDLTMIDASTDPWFDLDLVNYQAQLVNGYTRMTAQAGLEIFMPDLDEVPHKKATQSVTLEWLKDRNRPVPADVSAKLPSPGKSPSP